MDHRNQKSPFRDHFLIGFSVFFLATFLFVIFKSMDLSASAYLYGFKGDFLLSHTYLGVFLRNVFRTIYILSLIIAIFAAILVFAYGGKKLCTVDRKLIFVMLCLIIGPGLVANLTFKSNWGRARPLHLEQFGGTKSFTPPLAIANQCQGANCSFVSGEASNIFSLFFALGMVATGSNRRWLFWGGVGGGFAAGFVRMAQGGHFLSDVIFAGVFMWLTTLIVWWGIFHLWPERHQYLSAFYKAPELANGIFNPNINTE
jgi:lipid A 4'-phosphatase